MRIKRYIDHIDLGIDEASEEKNILVTNAKEFATLPEAQQRRAWATIAVGSEILGTTPQGIYSKIYRGKIPTKVIKKSPTDLQGLTFVRVYQSIEDRKARREEDQRKVSKTLKRALNRAPWLPRAHRELLVVLVSMKLREFERETLKNNENTTNTEEKYD